MIAVIGCGNPNRGDDGAGPAVIRALRRHAALPDDVRLFDAGTDGMAVMFAARGCTALILVDACRSGASPGTLFEVPGSELAQRHEPSLNLHDFRWDHALYAGRRLYAADFPADVTVLLIEAADTGYGIELSAGVAAAVERAADRLLALVGEQPR